jgi:cellulose synthase/poly-beta-1,6-N-acetylglucosamine synthase-like glycosyltransferase
MTEFPSFEHRRPPLRAERHARVAPAPTSVAAGRSLPLPFELAAFEGVVDPALLEAAATRAEMLGVGGDEVLRAHGVLPSELIAQAIADQLGLLLDPLDDELPPHDLTTACGGVFARIGPDDKVRVTVAPRGDGIGRLAEWVAREPRLADHLRMAAPERLAKHVRKVCAADLAHEAIDGLRDRRPDLSAKGYGWNQLRWFTILFAAAVCAAGILAPEQLFVAFEYFLGLSFISWMVLRLAACCVPEHAQRMREIPDRLLPIYTIIVPLYREAPVVGQLIAALRRIDYPREKLDIKLVLEEDDHDTRVALANHTLAAPFEIIAPPRSGPRTKPKALAAALPFARGSFVVVYDAEDDPDPDQLRQALSAFLNGPPELACVQARLAVDNVEDSWLCRHFAAEYAGQFDVFLPALAGFRLPLPLGGTSNHFRTDALRRAGGWDPFNVTEDADLGMRIARFGYRIGVINSTTWEEAPVGYSQWLRQRTRWFKGWMQTWTVHMRHPWRLGRELGLRGFMALQLLVGGTVLSALVHPFLLAIVLSDALSGALFAPVDTVEQAVRKGLALTTLLTGYLGSAFFGLVGLERRRMLRAAWVLPTIPFYWLLLSAAAWRALWQFVTAPYHWEKTEHGLARSSLRAERQTASARTRPIRGLAARRHVDVHERHR